jgi:protein gp37
VAGHCAVPFFPDTISSLGSKAAQLLLANPVAEEGLAQMSDNSKIEWTDATWNPVRSCTKISPGCKHCYAETFAERFRGVPGHPYEHGFDLRLVPDKLVEPLLWSAPRMIFVNSMSDLFQEDVPDWYVMLVARVMSLATWHTFQVLTKRSERMRDLLNGELAFAADQPHIWWGVSVENQRHGVPRIAHLRKARACVRFLSIEPLLEDLGTLDLDGIHWVIVGGESGHGARPMEAEWVECVRRQCDQARISFFFKQWGGVQKARNGRMLNDRTYDDAPPRLVAEVPDRGKRMAFATGLTDCVRETLSGVGDGLPLYQLAVRRL